jgi:hypothetical protein
MQTRRFNRWMALALCAALALGVAGAADSAAAYRNAPWGFAIDPPAFGRGETVPAITVAAFFAPPADGFAANMNIQVQPLSGSLEDFQRLSVAQFNAMGLESVSTQEIQVDGHRALEWVYRGQLQNRRLKFLSLAVARDGAIYLLTCTMLEKDFEKHEEAFRKSLASFRFSGVRS